MMKYKTTLVLLASTLTISGCSTSEPHVYGISDARWQRMSEQEKLIARQDYDRKLGHQHIVVARDDSSKKKDQKLARNKDIPSIESVADQVNEHSPMHIEPTNMTVQPADNKPAASSDSPKNNLVDTNAIQNDVHSVESNLPNQDTVKSSVKAVSDVSKEEMSKASQLIMDLHNHLGRQPLLSEMQHELQQNMGVSSGKARRIIQSLGLY